jgi:hypothetical protein
MSPIVLLIVIKDAKELFNFLVYTFHFSIHLGVESCRQGLIYVKFASGFSHKFGGKLGTSVGDYILWESCSSPDIIQVELGHFFDSDCFVAKGDNNGFTETIQYNKYRISIAGFREVSDKVHSDGFPYSNRNRVRMQGYLNAWFVFGGLANGTSIHIVLGELGWAWPSILSGD